MSSRKTEAGLAQTTALMLTCVLALAAASARGAAPNTAPGAAPSAATPAPGDVARLQAEVDRLKNEVREQRQLILQLMQAEQQRYDVVLKYLKSSGIGDASAALPSPKLPAGASAALAPAAAKPADETATISGRVRASGPVPGDVYVYVEGLRGSPARNHTVEIKQHDKQFAPRVVVVPVGTRLVFPNQDSVIHNVFSAAPGNAFDLGSIKGGTSTTPVVLLKPGAIEIFCNIHSKMRADVLVVGNPHWTKVAPDGSFQIPGVPVGTRKLALWSPTLKPVRQQVELTASGASVTFLSDVAAMRPHMNKRGQAYGSYDD